MREPQSPGGRPVGAILAGGLGRRIGGEKAAVRLAGAPLIEYPLRALRAELDEVIVVAKPQSRLPPLPGVTVWIETARLHHPFTGIVEALAAASGRAVLVCAVDLPFVSPELVRRLAQDGPAGALATVAAEPETGALQPLLARYEPGAAEVLARAAQRGEPVRAAVEALGPRRLEVDDPLCLFNVNTPEDLLRAAAILDRAQRE